MNFAKNIEYSVKVFSLMNKTRIPLLCMAGYTAIKKN